MGGLPGLSSIWFDFWPGCPGFLYEAPVSKMESWTGWVGGWAEILVDCFEPGRLGLPAFVATFLAQVTRLRSHGVPRMRAPIDNVGAPAVAKGVIR